MQQETKVVNVRLTLDEIKKLDKLAHAEDRSRAYMIRKLIRQSLSELQDNDSSHHEEDVE